MRNRLARIGGSKSGSPDTVLDPLIKVYRATHPKGDIAVIQKAYRVAEQMHDGQKRKSGDPYITHPLAVATILAELGMTTPTLCAALLHDTVEDTPYTLDQLSADFGDEVRQLVDGVTKLDKVKYGDSAQSETIRKMVVAMSRDIRVLVIKLADRLHNMRTLRYLRQDKQERIARETIEIFAPLAHRLGMNTIKWELEDLAFATLHPKVYDEIVRLVADRAPSREQFLERVVSDVESDLRHVKLKATVSSRPKHYYSIYQKMLLGGREFSDIFDLVGVRILVDTVADCYGVLGVLHARWNPIPGRFKDYISVPKFNMYQSLHTTVIGPQGKPVELQIRTYAMHRRAEYGVAAHWKYKEDATAGVKSGKAPDSNDMLWLRELLDWQSETESSVDFLDSLRFEINNAGVYAYTPRGDLIQLPAKATPVDFAYAVHTEVGHACIGARVNGRLVSLESTLESGDVVEIFTSKSPDAGPSRDWLEFVVSPRARNKIRQWFTKERREEAIERGKDLIAKQMRKEGLPLHRLFKHETLSTVATELHLPDVSTLYASVGEGNVGAQSVVERVIDLAGGREGAQEDLAEATTLPSIGARRRADPRDAGVIVEGLEGDDVMVKLARCCTPVPGDKIEGFVTRGAGVSVHRADCANLLSLKSQPERLVSVRWAPTGKSTFLVAIQVEGLDRPRLLSDITRVISDQHVNILSASLSTGRDRVAKSKFTFEMADPKHLGHVLGAVRTVEGVFDVYRLTQ
ncbi:RelA/SpoT family protein [Aeromicrobium chenweiae]|uniref:GTP pyrophosphokinase n=1 Tax=Aeromicrobium chenweiae TaxID=2079793 RepID=A0A2S0WS60_9ACTN|nr:bifunctional (p)ppGpp synthetase/guanosine-3',5'-bis(diphosphate) 3'-pyrophosphohydrolase [Aeromicrobium chenweiae]AWB94140.1 GTP pyrophosphokinase [Aeromicrobium chenweiae]TGN34521.1 bifunctional (p)ppGpp synthetase/guanosine-3',5'-bis(diphosphate) 3'-pyrophosphohydrolase [Aeromicrobium chenweiae]